MSDQTPIDKAKEAWEAQFKAGEASPHACDQAAARIMRRIVLPFNEQMMEELKTGIDPGDLAIAVNSASATICAQFLANAIALYAPWMREDLIDSFCREQVKAIIEATARISAGGGRLVNVRTGLAVGREGSIFIPPGAMERKQ
jgi:hypothetical protein